MAMRHPSVSNSSLPSTTNPPSPHAAFNLDVISELAFIVSCLEKLLPLLSAEISKPPINDIYGETTAEQIHGQGLVRLEEVDNMEVIAKDFVLDDLMVQVIPKEVHGGTKQEIMEIETKSVSPEMAHISTHKLTPNQPPLTGLAFSPTNLEYQLQQGPLMMLTKPQEVQKQLGYGKRKDICYAQRFGFGLTCKSSIFSLLKFSKEAREPLFVLKEAEPKTNYVGAVT